MWPGGGAWSASAAHWGPSWHLVTTSCPEDPGKRLPGKVRGRQLCHTLTSDLSPPGLQDSDFLFCYFKPSGLMTALGGGMAGLRGKEVRWLEMQTGSRVGEEAGRAGPCCHVGTVWQGRIWSLRSIWNPWMILNEYLTWLHLCSEKINLDWNGGK